MTFTNTPMNMKYMYYSLLKQCLLQMSSSVSKMRCREKGKSMFLAIWFLRHKFILSTIWKLQKAYYKYMYTNWQFIFQSHSLNCIQNPVTIRLLLLTNIRHFSYSHHVWPVLKCLSKEGICNTKNYTRPEIKDDFVRPRVHFPSAGTITRSLQVS